MDNYDKIQEGIKLTCEGFSGIFSEILSQFNKACKVLVNSLNPILAKKLTKKKFCKLLQSHGIQRNEIYKIINANKKNVYNYKYLYDVLGEYEK